METKPAIEPLVGSVQFVVTLTNSGFCAVMIESDGEPIGPSGDGGTASEAVADCLQRYPFTFRTDRPGVNVYEWLCARAQGEGGEDS